MTLITDTYMRRSAAMSYPIYNFTEVHFWNSPNRMKDSEHTDIRHKYSVIYSKKWI